ncbi:acyltransferase family protein [Pseudonocardia acidicola]|uniref:Acyltransferase family protein n=1 Tax=Pseudonocardia acidicola TaxID=2724939 RepID=A0ABX1SLZ3_9PSEU|nr:acyltransferase [Pseudonocardia acidicola]NMI01554.1 acyltransferase family protein [Pseudonocardia acidicola]
MSPARTTAPGGTSRANGELRALTGLRIVAAAWVVIFHFHFTPLPGVAVVNEVFGPLITAGALGVDLFFVLSGFVIAYTYLETMGRRLDLGPAVRFVWARVCRMWPAYVVVFNLFGLWLLARLAFGTSGNIAFQSVQPTVNVQQWVEQMFMVQLWTHDYFDGASWVGSTWSISAEWLAYLCFPVTALVFFRLRNLPRPVLALAAVAVTTPMAWAYVSTGNPYFPFSWLIRIATGFSAGVLAYLVVRRVQQSERNRRIASWVATGSVLALIAGLLLGEQAGPDRGGAGLVLFPILVGALAMADRGPARLLSGSAMVRGGRISYSLYLVHIPIFELYWFALARHDVLGQRPVLAHALIPVVLLAALLASLLLHRSIEEPWRNRMRGWVGARRPAPAPVATASAAVDEERDPVALALRTAAVTAPRPVPEPPENEQTGAPLWFTPAVEPTGPGRGPRPVPVPAASGAPRAARPTPWSRHTSTLPVQSAVVLAAALESRERRSEHRAWVQATS